MALVSIGQDKSLSIGDVKSVLFNNDEIKIDHDSLQKIEDSYAFLVKFAKKKLIYGINTSFGPMAQYKINPEDMKELQYNLIRSHAAGSGKKLPDIYIKSAMIVRLMSLVQGKSGIHPSAVLLLKELLNENIFPYIPEHGGVGASGDLVQLAHLALVLIGEGEVTYKGVLQPTKQVFEQTGLKPITVKLREGISLINGTSVMTGIGLINVIKSKQLLNWMLAGSAMLNELVESFDDHYSYGLNKVKKHNGQLNVARILRAILKDSKLITSRTDHFYNNHISDKVIKKKVQEYYSLRCLPQILGPVYDTIKSAEDVVVNEANSVSDNPVIDYETNNVYHGGNFHGDYVSLEMDKLRLVVTKLSMLSERQLAFLLNPKLNEILPPFVTLGKHGLNLGMQGIQFTATSTVAENQTLSNSMYVHSIPTNNDNQDIVSMGTNAALLTKRVIDNSFSVLAIEMIALAQAVDYLNIKERLSAVTRNLYYTIREIVPRFVEDTPKYKELKKVTEYLFNNDIKF